MGSAIKQMFSIFPVCSASCQVDNANEQITKVLDSNMFSFVDTIMAAIESDTKTKQLSRTFMGHMPALFEFITFKNGQLLTMLINFFMWMT